MTQTHVAIVGGSLAGSFAGYLLAKNGCRVTLIDPLDAQREKACGEGLSRIGKRYLEDAGLWNAELQAAAHPFSGYEVITDKQRKLVLDAKTPIGFSIRRNVLDRVLIEQARLLPGLSIIEERATAFRVLNDGWCVTTELNANVQATHLVLACGNSNSGLRSANAIEAGNGRRYAFAIRGKGKWRAGTPGRVLVKACGRRQFVLTPLAHGEVNVCAFATRRTDRKNDFATQEMRTQALAFCAESGFVFEKREEIRGAYQVNSGQKEQAGEGIYCIGDAAEVFDPIGGMGMSHAFFSAALAAEAILRSVRDPAAARRCWQEYEKTRRCYAALFRFKTGMSFALNVKGSAFIAAFAALIPGLSMKVLNSCDFVLPGLETVNG